MIIIRNAVLVLLVSIAVVLPASAHGQASASVLCYHAFLEKKKDPFCFTLEELNSHILQLRKEGFRFVGVNDIFSGTTTGTKNILITVDDGNRSVYEAFHKVFKPNGIRPLLGIYPNIIGKKKYALTWEQLKELSDSGCDIAAHGYFHLKVNQRLFDKNPGYFKKEIFGSKKALEERLDRKISIFVYPFGLFSDITIKALKEAGYRCAFTIDKGKIDMPVYSSDAVFELPRYMVTRTSWKYCFNSVIRNARSRGPVKLARSTSAAENIAVSRNARHEPDYSPVRPVDEKIAMPAAEKISLFESHPGDIPKGDATQTARQANIISPLQGKAGMEMKASYANIKKAYNMLVRDTYDTYNDFLRTVRVKVERMRSQIKQYVMGHF